MSVEAVCVEFADLAAGAAVDALEPADERRVEEHAAVCPRCAAILHDLREGAAVLGMALPQVAPPAALRTRLLSAAHQTPGRRRRRVRRLWSVPFAGVSPARVAVAASLIVSLGSITWAARLQMQLTQLQTQAATQSERASRYDHIAAVLASDRLSMMPLTPAVQTVQSRGMAFLDPISGDGMLMCRGLPPVAAGHAYQVWLVRGAERISAGMLWPDRAGNGYTLIQLPPDFQSYESLGLTDEPGNGGQGSQWPTSPGVMGAPLRGTTQ